MAFPDGWERRQSITIDNTKVPSTETDVPALITLDLLDSEVVDAGSNSALNGGGDLRFSSDEAGTIQLPLQVISFVTNATPGNRECELRVKVSSISSSVDTVIYIWYKKSGEVQPAVTDTFGRNAVWTQAEVAVLMEDITPVDSTGNHTLSSAGTLVNIDGPFGKANEFASTDRLSNTDTALVDILETNDTTLSVISRRTPYESGHGVVSWEGTDDYVMYPMDSVSGDGVRIFWRDVGGSQINNNSESLDNTWIWSDYVTRATSDHEIFTNAATAGTSTVSAAAAGPFTSFDIGGFSTQHWDGDIAQVIVWKTARSDGWITMMYNNEFATATFATAGTPEDVGGVTRFPQLSLLGVG